jgi:hypothetical protein
MHGPMACTAAPARPVAQPLIHGPLPLGDCVKVDLVSCHRIPYKLRASAVVISVVTVFAVKAFTATPQS